MKKKILSLIFMGSLGVYLTSVLFVSASCAGQENHSEFRPIPAKNVKLVKKVTVRGVPDGAKVKPEKPGKPDKQEETGVATGELGSEVTGNKYAIVIGIADYPGDDSNLRYTDEDAEEMYSALTTLYGYSSENIYPFIDKNGENTTYATREAISMAVEKLKYNQDSNQGPVLTENDEMVFFFSGHGGVGEIEDLNNEPIDELIWVHDGREMVPIWDDELRQWFDGFPTNRIIFVFDTCRAGGMTDLAQEGRIINMATTETGTAYEFSALENGQFSHYFVDEGMLQGLADKYDHNDDGVFGEPKDVTIEEAFDHAKSSYPNRYKRQGPTIVDLFTKDLLL